ncbi:hypothetical protein METBIDRAFT_179531 [Metschnikowia bicuspidata var. bicuspidata NRRL YB-4993]|uniref:BTB domain-containing protein n=1 Tax=Metschnikowia bicuspidata var. bicuspidata NRRL YB-4993 TaxID=869754 RepID=A0A1A0HBN0_9ASCO|nr:hypothetical protein METBIDRAFT_179531 [Metschnikowia bicuspidata var. bicuspidata NRRL YB-4993]OBA21293.1 hypothetical protein METBIDRAFT_179531 [Metschnikowia bicuspidata var. bicuspidata NRRL YB-4993]
MAKSPIAQSTQDGASHRGPMDGPKAQNRPWAALHRAGKHVAGQRDVFGRTLLHICVLADDPASFRRVLRAGDSRSSLGATDLENGWNVLHYICHHKRLRCFSVLMAFLDPGGAPQPVLKDLLGRKDRSGATPLALLQNDTKDLFWVPQYINENGRFHLARRFAARRLDGRPGGNGRAAPETPVDNGTAHGGNAHNTRASLRDVGHDWWCDTRGGSGIYVLGANAHGNLGVGDSHDRSVPVPIDRPEAGAGGRALLQRPRVQLVEMSTHHAVLGTTDGTLYSCGVGSRGRLGQGKASSASRFRQVVLPAGALAVTACAVSSGHTVVLTASGALYAWGQNTLNQLGFTSAAPHNAFKTIADVYENSPVEIAGGDLRRKTAHIRGVAVSKIHSVAHSAHSLYFWGLDVGQIAVAAAGEASDHRVHGKSYSGVVVPQPKEVPMRDEIKLVATCETCTCVVTVSNELFVYYMGQRAKLPRLPPRASAEAHFDFFKPTCLTRAPSVKKVAMKTPAAVHVLLDSGDVIAFGLPARDIKALRSTRYSYAWLASEPSMRAVDIGNSADGSLLVCTRNGSVYLRSNLPPVPQRRPSSTGMAGLVPSAHKKFRKVEGLNRVLRATCNDTFTSFAFIRDDADSLPLKLQKNDFLEDMEYLSPFAEPDLYRKQDQLLDTDHDTNCYVSDFLYPPAPEQSAVEDDRLLLLSRMKAGLATFNEKNEQLESNDLLRKRTLQKYSRDKNKEPCSDSVFQRIPARSIDSHIQALKACIAGAPTCAPYEWLGAKFCDGKIELAQFPNFAIGFHTDIFRKRSRLCEQIFLPQEEGEYFVHQKIKGTYDATKRVIRFLSEVEPLAVLIFVYFVYTNTLLEVWLEFEKDDVNIGASRRVKSDVLLLMTLFNMDVTVGKTELYLAQLQDSNKELNADVTIMLSRGESVTCSSLIISRSAFFETILSGRWESGNVNDDFGEDSTVMKYIGLEEISLVHMKVILAHLQGCHDLHVFDYALDTEADSWDSDDFVNFLLETIEIADELLLVQLKHLCELAIKEFISIDNVLVLVGHADWMGAKKLFMACCWYMYNNLEVVLFDNSLLDLSDSIVEKIEAQMQLLDKCKHPEFVVGDHGEVNWSVFCRKSGPASKITVENFTADLAQFNEIFMSDAKGFSSFEPLVDVKTDGAVTAEARRKLLNRRMSNRESGDVLSEVRRLSISSTAALPNKLGASGTKQSDQFATREEECAVVDDEEFEIVRNRRRKSKSRLSNHKGGETASLDTLLQSEGSSAADSDVPANLARDGPAPRTGSGAIRKHSAPFTTGPVLGPALGETWNAEKKQTRIKFAPAMKLSQKERRRLRHGNDTTTSSANNISGGSNSQQEFRNPWNITKSEEIGAASAVESDGKLKALPILGQKEAPAPKLSAIMLEEATRSAEEKEPVITQTLQEIQQEQEFAKWWEEECRRVQQLEQAQTDSLSGNNGQSHLLRTESRRGGRPRRGKGRRGG